MKTTIGDIVDYRGRKAMVKAFKYRGNDCKAIIEIYQQPPLFGAFGEKPKEKEILTVDNKELKVIESTWDHFYILKTGDRTIPFTNKAELLKAVTPKNFNKVEIFEVNKLGKPEIRVSLNPPPLKRGYKCSPYTEGWDQW